MNVTVIPLPYGARLIITTDADRALLALDQRRKRYEDVGPLLNALAAFMREALGRRFAEGGQPPWKPLAPATIAAKMAAGLPSRTAKGRIPWRLKQAGVFGAGNILIRTGALRDSYRVKSAPGHIETIDVEQRTVSVGSKLPYARYHQKGTAAYTIRPKTAKRLAFTGKGGQMVFARVVQHPGLPARPVLLSSAEKRAMAQMARAYFATGELQHAA